MRPVFLMMFCVLALNGFSQKKDLSEDNHKIEVKNLDSFDIQWFRAWSESISKVNALIQENCTAQVDLLNEIVKVKNSNENPEEVARLVAFRIDKINRISKVNERLIESLKKYIETQKKATPKLNYLQTF